MAENLPNESLHPDMKPSLYDHEDDHLVRMSDPLLEFFLPEDEPTLFGALRCSHQIMVENQIAKGFDINFKKSGEAYKVKGPFMSHRIQTSLYSPLHVAVLHSSIKTISLLINKGADVNIMDEQLRTPLHFAVVANRIGVVNLLIDFGAQMDLQSSSGRSPLIEAVIGENDECARLLVERGADLDLCDLKGSSVLHLLCFSRTPNMELIKFVLEKGAKVDITNKKGATPLMFAANLKQIPLVKLLLDHGANINHRDNQGYSAIHLCSNIQRRLVAGEPNILLYLIHQGAHTNIPDKAGKTILDKAIPAMSIASLKILLKTDCRRESTKIIEDPSVIKLLDIVPEFKEWLFQELYTPRSLMRLCRELIRDSLYTDRTIEALQSLEIPVPLQNFLLARDVAPGNLL